MTKREQREQREQDEKEKFISLDKKTKYVKEKRQGFFYILKIHSTI